MPSDLLDHLEPRIAEGQSYYAETLRQLIRILKPQLYDGVRSCSGGPFLEPLAFLHFSTAYHHPDLEQIFVGYLAAAKRPQRAVVFPDSAGYFYVPQVGHFRTDSSAPQLELFAPAASTKVYLEDHGKRIQHELLKRRTLPGTNVELCAGRIPQLDHCFGSPVGPAGSVDTERAGSEHGGDVVKALAILDAVWPELRRIITDTVRLLVIFRSVGLNSFATTAAHGAAFINAALGDDEVFFLEDLVHQCGHVIFAAAATPCSTDYLKVPPDTPMRVITGQTEDHRPVYHALHGLFTEALIARCLDAALTCRVLRGRQAHEAEGRLAFVLKRFTTDLRYFATEGVLGPCGDELMTRLRRIWFDLARRRARLVAQTDTSNQSYNFSYAKYAALNRPPAAVLV